MQLAGGEPGMQPDPRRSGLNKPVQALGTFVSAPEEFPSSGSEARLRCNQPHSCLQTETARKSPQQPPSHVPLHSLQLLSLS